MGQNAVRAPGMLSRAGIAAGAFVCAVSFSLFIHSISQLSSPIVSAAFIAAGVVLRQRASTATGQAIALGALVGGVVAAVASLALTAAGVGG
jgi:pyrrolidone-carboxylate peptidase